MKKLFSFSVIVLFILSLSSYAEGADKTEPVPSIVQKTLIPAAPKAPEFTLKDLSGKTVSLKDYRGKVVLLDFTTTWCPWCKKDIPNLKKLYASMKGKNFELLSIFINESPKKVESFASQYSLPYPVLLDTDASVAGHYGIRGVPTKIVVKKDGTISCWQCINAEEKINESLKEK
jgi:peroxiredoxin